MAGDIRSIKVNRQHSKVREKMEHLENRPELYKMDPGEFSDLIDQIPEFVHYHENRRGVSNDETYLHLAVKKMKIELATLLLEKGADPNARDSRGLTPLHYALKLGASRTRTNPDLIIDLLLDNGADIHARSDDLRSSLHWAVESAQLSHIKKALAAGAAIDRPSIDGVTPLHDALFLGLNDIVEHLTANHASIDIYSAAGLGDLEKVKRFLHPKPNRYLKLQGDSGRSALMYATIGGQIEIVNLLLSKATGENRYSNEQLRACISKAIDFGHTNCALKIISKARPSYGPLAPPPFQSLYRQHPPSRNFWGMPIEPEIHEAAERNQANVVKALIARGWDVDELNADDQTALHRSANRGAGDSMKALIDSGAAIEAKTGRERYYPCGPIDNKILNETALHLAVGSG